MIHERIEKQSNFCRHEPRRWQHAPYAVIGDDRVCKRNRNKASRIKICCNIPQRQHSDAQSLKARLMQRLYTVSSEPPTDSLPHDAIPPRECPVGRPDNRQALMALQVRHRFGLARLPHSCRIRGNSCRVARDVLAGRADGPCGRRLDGGAAATKPA